MSVPDILNRVSKRAGVSSGCFCSKEGARCAAAMCGPADGPVAPVGRCRGQEMRVPGRRPAACYTLSLGRGEGRSPIQVPTVFCKVFLILHCPLVSSVNDVFLCASEQLMCVFGPQIHIISHWMNMLYDTLLLPLQERLFLGFSVWYKVQHDELKMWILVLFRNIGLQFTVPVTIPSGVFIHLGLVFHGDLMEYAPHDGNIFLMHSS